MMQSWSVFSIYEPHAPTPSYNASLHFICRSDQSNESDRYATLAGSSCRCRPEFWDRRSPRHHRHPMRKCTRKQARSTFLCAVFPSNWSTGGTLLADWLRDVGNCAWCLKRWTPSGWLNAVMMCSSQLSIFRIMDFANNA
jgi:hypothetical protein